MIVKMGWRSAVIAVLLLGAGPLMAASRYTVTIDPPKFSVDESAQLTITVTGDEDAVPIIPRVSGLVINPYGQSSSIQQVNGAVTAIFARTYRVTAMHEGTFVIPPIQVGSAHLQPVSVQVVAPGAAPPPRPQTTAPAASAAPPDTAAAVRAAMPVMRIELPKSPIYMGQLVPIQIKVYFKEGTTARYNPVSAAAIDAFTVSGLTKAPTQTRESAGGINYQVLTWTAVLGALKSGAYPLNFELPMVLSVQVGGGDSDMASRLRALFGTSSPGAFMDDSAFGNLFGRVIQRELTVKSEATRVTVLPLPEEGRPANFSGAVGQFQISSELASKEGVVGDPLTFKTTVTGHGNLALVNAQPIADSPQWRAYRSESKVTADDESGIQGFKTFTQPVVPLEAGQMTLPGISFSYFDPQAQQYVTRATAPIAVTVRPGTVPVAAHATGPVTAATAQSPRDALAADVPVDLARGTLQPLVWQRWFLAAIVTPVIAMLLAVAFIRRQQRRSADPALALHAARLAAVQINIESMGAALSRGDTQAFFAAARHALQERLADLWQVPAESVDQRLVAQRMPQEAGAELRAIFAMAEKATYAGESPGSQVMQDWHKRILRQMDRLEAVT